MSGKPPNINSNSMIGLDLSLSGSQINPGGNLNINNNATQVQTPKKVNSTRPTSATSNRSYIIPRTVIKTNSLVFTQPFISFYCLEIN